MPVSKKPFDFSQSLERSVHKRKPAVYSDSDINLTQSIVKNAIDALCDSLGTFNFDSTDKVISSLTASMDFPNNVLDVDLSLADSNIFVKGSVIGLASQTIEQSLPIDLTTLNKDSRTFGVWLSAKYTQYVSSAKSTSIEYDLKTGIKKIVSDAIASITYTTTASGSLVTNTLEGMDFVGFTEPKIELIKDVDFVKEDGEYNRLARLAIISVSMDGTVTIHNEVDAVRDLYADLSTVAPVSVRTLIPILRKYVDDNHSDLEDYVDNSIANLSSVYQSLPNNNLIAGRNAKKVHQTDLINITTDPIITPGGNISTVSALTPTSVSSINKVAAYYEPSTKFAAIFVNSADTVHIDYSGADPIILEKIYCNSSFDLSKGSGFRNYVRIIINMPNVPVSNNYESRIYSPSILHNVSGINIQQANVLGGTKLPLFGDGPQKEVVIDGYFNSPSNFVVTDITTLNSLADSLETKYGLISKLDKAPIVLNINQINTLAGIDFAGYVSKLGRLVTINLDFEIDSPDVSTFFDPSTSISNAIFDLPSGWEPLKTQLSATCNANGFETKLDVLIGASGQGFLLAQLPALTNTTLGYKYNINVTYLSVG